MSEKINKAMEWYLRERLLYESLAKKASAFFEETLISESINFHSITYRVKSEDSFRKKAAKEKYSEPTNEIKDLAGIRAIAYVAEDVDRICDVVKQLFEIDQSHSADKGQDLGIDKFGYRSIHFVGTLTTERLRLPEYQKFKDMCFEIQVRTILQHAWAEIEHDRNYKFQGVLPDSIKRRFAVLAGVLELADREFNDISKEIDMYAKQVRDETSEGNLNIPINSTSLREFMLLRFKGDVLNGLKPSFGGRDDMIVQELRDFGIFTLADLERIIPSQFSIKAEREIKRTSFLGIIRTFMMLSDTDRYFKDAWKNHWAGLEIFGLDTFKNYDIAIEKFIDKYSLEIFDPPEGV